MSNHRKAHTRQYISLAHMRFLKTVSNRESYGKSQFGPVSPQTPVKEIHPAVSRALGEITPEVLA